MTLAAYRYDSPQAAARPYSHGVQPFWSATCPAPIERRELGDNGMPGKPAIRKMTACWSCESPIALKPGYHSYHCVSCDVLGSDEPALIQVGMTKRTFYFLSWNGRTKLEHYVEHNGSSLSSPA